MVTRCFLKPPIQVLTAPKSAWYQFLCKRMQKEGSGRVTKRPENRRTQNSSKAFSGRHSRTAGDHSWNVLGAVPTLTAVRLPDQAGWEGAGAAMNS